jgi:hypothetical protein
MDGDHVGGSRVGQDWSQGYHGKAQGKVDWNESIDEDESEETVGQNDFDRVSSEEIINKMFDGNTEYLSNVMDNVTSDNYVNQTGDYEFYAKHAKIIADNTSGDWEWVDVIQHWELVDIRKAKKIYGINSDFASESVEENDDEDQERMRHLSGIKEQNKELKEGSFWGRDDMVKKMKDEEKAAGMKKFVKIDDKGNHHGTTTSDKEKWKELIAKGYEEDKDYYNESDYDSSNKGRYDGSHPDDDFDDEEEQHRRDVKHGLYGDEEWAEEEVYFNYGDIGGNIIVNPKSTIEDQIAELLNQYYDIGPMEFDPSKIEIVETIKEDDSELSIAKKQPTFDDLVQMDKEADYEMGDIVVFRMKNHPKYRFDLQGGLDGETVRVASTHGGTDHSGFLNIKVDDIKANIDGAAIIAIEDDNKSPFQDGNNIKSMVGFSSADEVYPPEMADKPSGKGPEGEFASGPDDDQVRMRHLAGIDDF